MPVLSSRLDVRSDDFARNRRSMEARLRQVAELMAGAAAGGGDEAAERLRRKGKLPVRDRINLLLDRDSPFLELMPLAGAATDHALGGGAVTGVGVVRDTECVLVANDPTVMGGALTVLSTRKIERALEVARQNRLPYIQLVESAGGDLRSIASGDTPDQLDAGIRGNMYHFSASGRMFHDITELSARGIPTVSVVFGSSTAGGAYQPGLSDYNIFVRNQAQVFLAGPPLVRVATGEQSSAEELGGADMHATVSGLADYLAEDETQAISMCRDVVGHLRWKKRGGPPVASAEEPLWAAEELLGVVPDDPKTPFDAREVICRIVDGSRFEEFKAAYGSTIVCGWATLHGYPVGILANNGVLFNESAQKAGQFIQLCNQIHTPLLFLQNVTGYMVGREYEGAGIVKHGSQMINALSNSTVPHITVVLGSGYGAGYYGMGGRAFDTRFMFLWPTARIAVMGARQMAGVMSIVRSERARRRGDRLDRTAEEALVANAEYVAEQMAEAIYTTGRGYDDGIIDPRDTRHVVGMALSACHSGEVEGQRSYGVFRF